MLLEALHGIQCDKPDCHNTRFIEEGEIPEGFSGTVKFVARADANGPKPVTAEWFACRDTHMKDAVRAALARAAG